MPRVGHNFSLRHFEIAKPPTYFNQEFWFNLVTFAFFSHAFRQGIIPGVKLRREKTLTFFLLFFAQMEGSAYNETFNFGSFFYLTLHAAKLKLSIFIQKKKFFWMWANRISMSFGKAQKTESCHRRPKKRYG